MKTKKRLKRAAAVLMCVVLLATSIPFAFSANADSYNPAPYFTDVGRILRTFKIKKNVEVTDNGKIII